MNRFALSLAAAALAGCTPAPAAQMDAPAPEAAAMPQDSLRRLPEAQQGIFQYNSGMEMAMRETVRDAAVWRATWTQLTSRAGPPVQPPEVDFAREMVLVAALGQRRSGGYAIRIDSVHRDGDELVAKVVQTSPGARCGVIAAITAPADVVIVPHSDAPVRWAVSEIVADCP